MISVADWVRSSRGLRPRKSRPTFTEVLEPTAPHLLYSVDRGGWVPTEELQLGEHLFTQRGTATVSAIERLPNAHQVFNLEVESRHEYFVSHLGVLTHNVDSCVGKGKQGAKEPATTKEPKTTPRVSSKTLRRRWEKATGKKWPKDPKTGRNQDVAHKRALADEGTNDVDNIKPQAHDEHMREHSEAGDFQRWGARGKKGSE